DRGCRTLRTCRPDQARRTLRTGRSGRASRTCCVSVGIELIQFATVHTKIPGLLLVRVRVPPWDRFPPRYRRCVVDFEPLPARPFEDDPHRRGAAPQKDPHRHYQLPVHELLAQITLHEPQVRADHLLGALPCLLERNPFVWAPNFERPPELIRP